MFDWREFFPVEYIAPILGGILVWFGLNYVFIAPSVLGPRLAEKYYLPACTASISTLRKQRADFEMNRQEARETVLRKLAQSAKRTVRRQTTGLLKNFFLGYGKQGRAFVDYYGDQIGEKLAPSGMINMGIDARIAEKRAEMERQDAKERRELRKNVRFTTVPEYCGCVVSKGMSDRVDLAAYTSSLRIYTPASIKELESGKIVSQAYFCGKPPII